MVMWSKVVGDLLRIEDKIWVINLKRKQVMRENNLPAIRLTDIK